MRIFLDNKGTGFKTVAVPFPCNMYALVEIMRKKVFTDTVGFGIYEVRDGSGKCACALVFVLWGLYYLYFLVNVARFTIN